MTRATSKTLPDFAPPDFSTLSTTYPSPIHDTSPSTYDAIETQGTVPTIPLPPSRPFHTLWRDHLSAFRAPGLYDTVIDTFVALVQGLPTWRTTDDVETIVNKRREVRELLRQHPPNVVLVSGMEGVYGYHPRRASLWPFICISDEYVDLWMKAKLEASEADELPLTAVLRATFDHEIARWGVTLVGIAYAVKKNLLRVE
ncbi:unnamed protein product [Cyclocybe aegerita]|uniref:Uncharacterized protein n=1 Tax=Cyclocybe aegerita TaxID=1973307 RepID=A0A8S0XG86_CYCAE|nr:unnamed protein product [Cyclocybe aegerita]